MSLDQGQGVFVELSENVDDPFNNTDLFTSQTKRKEKRSLACFRRYFVTLPYL